VVILKTGTITDSFTEEAILSQLKQNVYVYGAQGVMFYLLLRSTRLEFD
jgi:hypothetical protein